jgi:hypothetical protein
MFATLALRSIKCVNSNLLGIWNFTEMHLKDFQGIYDFTTSRIVLIPGDCEGLRKIAGYRI